MPIFRFHRGSLEDSMKTCFIVKDKKELYEKICRFNKLTNKERSTEDLICISENIPSEESLSVKNYIYDERIGWHTQIVIVKNRCVTIDPYMIGFLSEPFNDLDEKEN